MLNLDYLHQISTSINCTWVSFQLVFSSSIMLWPHRESPIATSWAIQKRMRMYRAW
uniref:Uncharacterized protein n=1 Tax=Rhizophora mucronata TaxID=61149 RepID=A0A2P2QEC4_RHIMU